MVMSDLVSIIIPCFNQEKYLEECLYSVLNQTYKNWECIIINDGSTDNSENIAKKYENLDSRFQYKYITNGGVSNARNFAISLSKGNYILPLDGDDKIGNEYLFLAVAEFQKNPETKLVYCLANMFGNVNEYWPLPPFNYEYFLFQNTIFCSAFYKKSDYLKTSGYDVSMRLGYEDWDFWLRLINKNDLIIRINSVEFYYRQTLNSRNSFIENEENHKKTIDYIYKKNLYKYIEILGFETKQEEFYNLQQSLIDLEWNINYVKELKQTITFRLFYKLEKEIQNFKRRFIRKLKKNYNES